MAAIKVRNLNFTYPTGDKKALDDVSFDIQPSEFVVVCGKSGCGKSTLLRQLKKNLVPYGDKSGAAYYEGTDITELDDRINASEIGFVQQNPDNQIVTDKVWHELAFGLESLGLDNQSIKRRVAEMASFFDIQTWFRKDVSELSGGQKQRAAIARMLTQRAPIMVFDDSLSAVDAETDLKIRTQLKNNLGKSTVVLISHRVTTLMSADCILVLDKGEVKQIGTHEELMAQDGIYRSIFEMQMSTNEVSA